MDWLGRFFSDLFDGLGRTDWGWSTILKVVLYLIGIAGMIYLILKLVETGFKPASFRDRTNKQDYGVVEENIHELDFPLEIEKSVELGEFRKAIRLIYLYTLKQLSDRELIYWETGKTNHEYLYELQSTSLRPIFSDLGYYFEFTWYGNFEADRRIYDQTRKLLQDFQETLEKE
jgi:hypothetical protein